MKKISNYSPKWVLKHYAFQSLGQEFFQMVMKQNQTKRLGFYDKIFETLEKYGIEPIVTINHFDTPYYLAKNYGGWYNRKTVDFFLNYATILFKRYSNQVKYWITHNEINMILHIPYIGGGLIIPDIENKTRLCTKPHIINLSHQA